MDIIEYINGKDVFFVDQQKIYYVSPISLDKITEDDIKKQFEIYKIKYNKKISYERYLEMAKSYGETKYSISSFYSSFHLDLDEAKEYATKNIGDINEAGCYKYVGVVGVPVGATYYNTYINPDEDIFVYKYNRDKDEYFPFTKDDDSEIFEYLKYHL